MVPTLSSIRAPRPLAPGAPATVRRGQARAGLVAQVAAPAGSGRLVRLPFYGTAAPTNIPRTAITCTVVDTFVDGGTLTTEDVPYALARIVGFVAEVSVAVTQVGSGFVPATCGAGLVRNLHLRGSASLFIHEQWADASFYDTDTEHLCGLREYPMLRSPNRCTVDVGAICSVAGGLVSTLVVVSCALVLDVLDDDVFGPGVPGPYSG